MADVESKICQKCRQEFEIDAVDRQFYERVKVPAPTWCPQCRMIRRFLFRNERTLFRRKEDLAGKDVFSSFPASAPVRIYENSYWWGDAWDPMNYGCDFNFSKPFFGQFFELFRSVPLFSRSVLNMVNSDYCDQAGDIKNSYLCFNGYQMENSAYIVSGWTIKESFDLYEARHSELSYESYMADECFRVFFSVNCEDCVDVWFSRNMVGCSNCFGCVNLRNKSYYIFNKKHSKEEYLQFMKELDLGSYAKKEEMLKKAHEFWKTFPMRFVLAIQVVNSTGEHIEQSKDLKWCYSVHDGENLGYSQFIEMPAKDSYDYTNWGGTASRVYESLTCGFQVDSLKFCWECWNGSRELEYCAYCPSSSNLFGCVGLRKKEYCIFNKQYTKEEYFALRDKIVQQMKEMPYKDSQGLLYRYGEFFPPEFSPFAYNETLANDFFPLTEQEVQNQGYVWRQDDKREFEITVQAAQLPDHIRDTQDSITKEIISCSSCSQAFRIIQMELDFYRRISISLPRMCPNCRFGKRFEFVNPPRFWHRTCQCIGSQSGNELYKNAVTHKHAGAPCGQEFETAFPPDSPCIVYCEQCYKAEVI